MFLLTLTDYFVKEDTVCDGVQTNWANLNEAKQQCSLDPSCGVIYDVGGHGTHFRHCAKYSTQYSSSGSKIYTKGTYEKTTTLTLQ